VTAPLDDEPPPPPLLVPATRELSRFGWIWTALGIALVVAAFATGAAAELDGGDATLILVLIGLSLGGVLGALLLARRTGPEILYFRILDRAPPPPPGVPRETPGATTRRVASPAIAIVLVLLGAGIVGAAMMLLLGGQPREEVNEDIPAGALIAAGAWTLACGVAGLRIASYFDRWQRLRDAVVLCRPLKAGTMRPVYWVERP
jgi:MFS family permease